MSALRWALHHPANHGHRAWVLRRWIGHQIVKRLAPGLRARRRVAEGAIVGPSSHPTICLCTYVRHGLVDVDAFVVYAAILNAGDHFCDVGAGIGLHAVVASSFVGREGRVVCVEPDRLERMWLAHTRTLNGATWEIEPRPLAERKRQLAWHSPGATTGHLVQPPSDRCDPAVETSTLDELVVSLRLDPGRLFIKIDVEGWEPAVVAGGLSTIRAGVKGIWLEANGLQGRCDISWGEAVAALLSCDYRPYLIDVEARLVERAPENVPAMSPSGNYLFLPGEAGVDRIVSVLDEWQTVLGGSRQTRRPRPHN